MDIFSHGLYGGGFFGRKSRRDFWTAFFFGVFPDLFSFGVFTVAIWLGLSGGPEWGAGRVDQSLIPQYVFELYNVTHSLIVFLTVFGIVWAIRKKPFWLMCGWGFHILVDIFSHDLSFFPTPFLWPVSDFHVDGVSWGHPWVFFPNLAVLAAIYGYWWYTRRQQRKS